MGSSFLLAHLALLVAAILFNTFPVSASLGQKTASEGMGTAGRRLMMSFKETPSGDNVTFDCTPSGPCVACQYSEKNDAKYRCSETGYRIPLKCIDVEAGSKESNNGKKQNNRSTLENSYDKVKVDVMLRDAEEVTTISQRNLLDDSSMSKGASEAYITYRSCIPAVNEEKLSVLGFEGIIFCSLVASGSVVFFRRKQSGAMSGAVRVPTNPRF